MKNRLGARRKAIESRTAEIVAQGGTWNARHILPKSAPARERIIAQAKQSTGDHAFYDDHE